MPEGAEFQVNTYTTSQQLYPVVGAGDGGFVVAWTSNGSPGTDTSLFSVQGQRYASDGSPRGAQFQVNTITAGHQRNPSVAAAPNGTFLVARVSEVSQGTDTDSFSIQGRRYRVADAVSVPALSPAAIALLCAVLLMLGVPLSRRLRA